MNHLKSVVLTVLMSAALAAAAQSPAAQTNALTLADAKKVIAAAVAEARRVNAPGGAIAVVDEGGHLLAVERLDDTFAAGANISIGKARTAALFKKPTKVFEDLINKGRTTMVTLPDFTPLQGGVPIAKNGRVVGGIGVSGAASAPQDEQLAIAGAAALNGDGGPASASVTYFDRTRTASAFAKGAPLLEVDGYKVHASRREKPGEGEVHLYETDVIYVLEGTATFVTGGALVDPRTTAEGEIRGPSIKGGESRRLAKGDVIVVPPNTPHQFTEVTNPFLYFVVKPISH